MPFLASFEAVEHRPKDMLVLASRILVPLVMPRDIQSEGIVLDINLLLSIEHKEQLMVELEQQYELHLQGLQVVQTLPLVDLDTFIAASLGHLDTLVMLIAFLLDIAVVLLPLALS